MTFVAGNANRDSALLRRARRDAANAARPAAAVPVSKLESKHEPRSVIAKAKRAVGDSALMRRVRRGDAPQASPAAGPASADGQREQAERSVVEMAKRAVGDSALMRRVRRGDAPQASPAAGPVPDADDLEHPVGDAVFIRQVARGDASDAHPATGAPAEGREERHADPLSATEVHQVAVGPVATGEVRERLEPVEPSPARRKLLRLRSPFVRAPREAATAERVPVRFRVARAVGTAASALPESRAVRVGTAVATVVAENQGILRAGLAAASVVPVLRPYVKVAVAATSAISVAHRVVRAGNKATSTLAALRRPEGPAIAHAGNGFGVPRREAAPLDAAARARYANPAAYRSDRGGPAAVPAQAADGDAKPEEAAGE
jgi:hypothetical protein